MKITNACRLVTAKMNLSAVLALAAITSLPAASFAAPGTWAVDANGNWGDPANWVGGTAADIADGAGNTADFSVVDLTVDRTVTLDQDRTLGILKFGDNGSNGKNWALAGGYTITLDNGADAPKITPLTYTSIDVALTGTNGFTMFSSTTQTLELTNTTNTLSGNVNIVRGTIRVRPTSSGGTNLGTGDIATSAPATLDFLGNTYANVTNTINMSRGTLRLGGQVTLNGALNLTGGSTQAHNVNFTGGGGGVLTIAAGAVVGNTGRLKTDGNGSLVFIGNKTGSGDVFIDTNVRLGGTGSINGNTTVNGKLESAWVAGGDAVGVLTFIQNLTLNSSAETTFDILNTGLARGTDYDGVNVGGDLAYDGTLNIAADLLTDPAYLFDLFDVTGATSGDLAAVNITGDYSLALTNAAGVWTGVSGTTAFTFTQSTGDLIVTNVPEPATLGLLAVGGLMMMVQRKR